MCSPIMTDELWFARRKNTFYVTVVHVRRMVETGTDEEREQSLIIGIEEIAWEGTSKLADWELIRRVVFS